MKHIVLTIPYDDDENKDFWKTGGHDSPEDMAQAIIYHLQDHGCLKSRVLFSGLKPADITYEIEDPALAEH